MKVNKKYFRPKECRLCKLLYIPKTGRSVVCDKCRPLNIKNNLRKWNKENREYCNTYHRKLYKDNNEYYRVKKRKYIYSKRKSNPKLTKLNYKRDDDNRKFGGLREFIILRDNEKCVQCGIKRSRHYEIYKLDLVVDHIDQNGYGKPRHLKNNDPDNLQTLCFCCHGKKSIKEKISSGKFEAK